MWIWGGKGMQLVLSRNLHSDISLKPWTYLSVWGWGKWNLSVGRERAVLMEYLVYAKVYTIYAYLEYGRKPKFMQWTGSRVANVNPEGAPATSFPTAFISTGMQVPCWQCSWYKYTVASWVKEQGRVHPGHVREKGLLVGGLMSLCSTDVWTKQNRKKCHVEPFFLQHVNHGHPGDLVQLKFYQVIAWVFLGSPITALTPKVPEGTWLCLP